MPNKHKLGAYIAPGHGDWKKYLFEIDPAWVRILMPGSDPMSVVSDVYQLCPDAEISLRWWGLDDGGDANKLAKFVEPELAGKRDVQEMVRNVEMMANDAARQGKPFPPREQIWFNTPNEPPVQKVALRPAIATNARAMIREAHKFGFGMIALEVSVGNPPEWPPEWQWADGVFEDILTYEGVLGLHEYWQPEGFAYVWTDNKGDERRDWGALAGRYLHLEADVPIVITETGVDGRIYERHATPDTGFVKFMNGDQYASDEQMRGYLREVKKDDRILNVLPFLTDVQDKEWDSFNTLYAQSAFVRMLAEMDNEHVDKPDEGGTPVTVHLPSVHGGGGNDESSGDAPTGMVYTVTHDVIDPFVAKAIMQVESGGEGFNADGSLKIRFEAHIFERYVPKVRFDAHFRYDHDNILNAWYRQSLHTDWIPYHNSQRLEHMAFNIASGLIDKRAAHLSTSMGAAQIMGFNHARVGFVTPELMYEAFSDDDFYHTLAFMNYCLGDKVLMEAIKAKDWRTIAVHYNGPGLVDMYSKRLEDAYLNVIGERNVQK